METTLLDTHVPRELAEDNGATYKAYLVDDSAEDGVVDGIPDLD